MLIFNLDCKSGGWALFLVCSCTFQYSAFVEKLLLATCSVVFHSVMFGMDFLSLCFFLSQLSRVLSASVRVRNNSVHFKDGPFHWK